MAVSKMHGLLQKLTVPPPHLLNLKVDYDVHYNLPRVPVLRQTNRNHALPAYFSEIDFNIILALPNGCFHLRFPNQNMVHAPVHLIFLDFVD